LQLRSCDINGWDYFKDVRIYGFIRQRGLNSDFGLPKSVGVMACTNIQIYSSIQ